MTSPDTQTPRSPEAEQVVLGTMMYSANAIGDILGSLTVEDFYLPRHQTIFESIVRLHDSGESDEVAVITDLRARGEIDRCGGHDYVSSLVTRAQPSSVNFYSNAVKETSIKRQLIAFHQRGITQSQNGSGLELKDLLSATQSDFDKVIEERATNDIVAIGDVLEPTMNKIEDLGRGETATTGVPFGFLDLDDMTSGMHPGQMIVVAARPAVGKSTLGLDLARSSALKHGLSTLIFSLEMSSEEITMRMLSAECRVELNKIRSGRLDAAEWGLLSEAIPRISQAPLFIDDTASITMPEIKTKARRIQQRHKLSLIIIDYMQLMSGSKKADNRQQEVSEISRSTKLLAKELGVPVVVMAQLNRSSEQRADKKPAISDLRESGSIEQDADVVILMHREDSFDSDTPRAGECDLIVAKQRNGPTGTVVVASQLHYSRFVDMANER